jgi:hypothetical protein
MMMIDIRFVPSRVTARFDANSLQSLDCDGVTP